MELDAVVLVWVVGSYGFPEYAFGSLQSGERLSASVRYLMNKAD